MSMLPRACTGAGGWPVRLTVGGSFARFPCKWIGNSRSALGLGELTGALLLSWKHLQSPPVQYSARTAPEFPFENVVCPVRLSRIEQLPSDRPGDQVGDLQARGIALLVRHDDLERQRIRDEIVARADPAEHQLDFSVLLRTSLLEEEMRGPSFASQASQEHENPFQPETRGDGVRVVRYLVASLKPVLVNRTGDEREGARFDQGVQVGIERLPPCCVEEER